MDLSTLTLPDHIHAEILTGTDAATGEQLAYPVIWADGVVDTCPRCHQPIPTEPDCPVILDTGAGQDGQILEWDQKHGCGFWLTVDWREVPVDPDDPDAAAQIEAAARELAAERDAEIETETDRLRRSLKRDLTRALKHLGEPLDGDDPHGRIRDVTTGSEVEPGVYLDEDNGMWVAWEHAPGASDEIVEVTAETVSYAQAGSMLGVSRARISALVAEAKLTGGEGAGVAVRSVLDRLATQTTP